MSVLVVFFFLLVLGILFFKYYTQTAQFGGKITPELTVKYARSPNWSNGMFKNLTKTRMNISFGTLPEILIKQFRGMKQRSPQSPLPVVPFNEEAFERANGTAFIWYGHSTVLLKMDGKKFLIDPMFGRDASPIAPFTAKRFSENSLEIIDRLPSLDAILLTHDHYDHLDYDSIKKLRGKTNQWMVALGVGRHLVRWGIRKEQIMEFDWWDKTMLQDIDITFTPSRHFSGRGPGDRSKCLWGGWAFISETSRVYWSGDGGYGNHFKKIYEKLGAFDLAFMECGQYNEHWHQIHLFPEEAVQAAIDVHAKYSVPVHWGGFNLALHHWKDPIQRFYAASIDNSLSILTPRLGEIGQPSSPSTEMWWDEYA